MDFRIDFAGYDAASCYDDASAISGDWSAPGIAGLASGFAAGTEIATTTGWRTVEALAPGDRILTFDHGSQPVRAVQRGVLWRGRAPCPEPLWPLLVPEGVLGNSTPLTLLAEQSVLVESDLAEDMYGDPFVLLPARYLEGALGIRRIAPPHGAPVEVIVPLFDRPEVAFANGAALVFCPARGEGETVPLNRLAELQIPSDCNYLRPCTPREARRLAEALENQRPLQEDRACAIGLQAA
ncbi:Hint domain-containing protein [Rhodovulum euryhalinum]|uniref:Hint domain-containing protein n=1 Tax=Rhodovulum euryhalinum TaxID=35805 RepID=A0A4R2KKB7_9RHOB|nr:Hint domain-containing protein [Rhodovulum euryhalinum]TCO72897.1 Hint domain-containing protein [Rhodovulum euryhalinum]